MMEVINLQGTGVCVLSAYKEIQAVHPGRTLRITEWRSGPPRDVEVIARIQVRAGDPGFYVYCPARDGVS
jgi:hypothetical protein